jgi:hypothetical protein
MIADCVMTTVYGTKNIVRINVPEAVLSEYLLALVSADNDVIECPFRLYSRFARQSAEGKDSEGSFQF